MSNQKMLQSKQQSKILSSHESEHGPPPVKSRDLKMTQPANYQRNVDESATDDEQFIASNRTSLITNQGEIMNKRPVDSILPCSKSDEMSSAILRPKNKNDSKDSEIYHLRNELEISKGKIKGYQTLGQLFQESKQECSKLKQRCEQLSLQLEKSLEKQSLPNMNQLGIRDTRSDITAKSIAFGHSVSTKPGSIEVSPTSDHRSEAHASLELCTHSTLTPDSPERNLVSVLAAGDEGPKGTPSEHKRSEAGSPKGHSGVSASSTSSSFVRINSSDTEGSDVEDKQRRATNERISVNFEPNLLSEIRQLNEYLCDPSFTPSADSPDLTKELVRIGSKAVKLEKQFRVQQTLINVLNEENTQLKKENEALRNTSQHYANQTEKGFLRPIASPGTKGEIITERDRFQEPYSSSLDEPKSMEWVECQQNVDHSSALLATGGDPVVTTMSVREKKYQTENQQLHYKLKALQDANVEWQTKCSQLEAEKQQCILQHQEETGRLKRDLKNCEQKHADQLSKLHTERQQCTLKLEEEIQRRQEAETGHAALLERKTQLENELKTLSAQQLEPVDAYFLRSTEHPSTVAPSTVETELRTQLLLLRQQVTVFKEDFDHERRDREKAKAETEEFKKRNSALNMDLIANKELMRKAESNLAKVKNENKELRNHIEKMSQELNELLRRQAASYNTSSRQQQTRSEELLSSFYRGANSGRSPRWEQRIPQQPRRPVPSQSSQDENINKWPCYVCTYMNPMQKLAVKYVCRTNIIQAWKVQQHTD